MAQGVIPLAPAGPTGSATSQAVRDLYLGALGEMPTIAGAPDSLAFVDGASARSRQARDAVWSSPEASSDQFVFSGSRWRSWTVRAVALLAVAVVVVWIATTAIGLRTTPATLPSPPAEAHQVNR